MRIRDYGEIILCRDITFEDNKYDLEQGHPGVVLLPTSEHDENTFCLYMTSDKMRAQRENGKYIKCPGKLAKESYINLQHIIKAANNKEAQINSLSDTEFMDLLKKFYDFQMSIEPLREEFLQIKQKIEALLDLLEVNRRLGIDDAITAELLDDFKGISDSSKRKRLYGTSLLVSGSADEEKVKRELFSSEKERIYNDRFIEIYNKLRTINFENLNLSDPNNALRNIYMDFRSKNFLINADLLFSDVATLFDNDIKASIYNFIKGEEERRQTKQQNMQAKSSERKNQKRIQQARANRNRKAARRKRDEEKYGRFEDFK